MYTYMSYISIKRWDINWISFSEIDLCEFKDGQALYSKVLCKFQVVASI